MRLLVILASDWFPMAMPPPFPLAKFAVIVLPAIVGVPAALSEMPPPSAVFGMLLFAIVLFRICALPAPPSRMPPPPVPPEHEARKLLVIVLLRTIAELNRTCMPAPLSQVWLPVITLPSTIGEELLIVNATRVEEAVPACDRESLEHRTVAFAQRELHHRVVSQMAIDGSHARAV